MKVFPVGFTLTIVCLSVSAMQNVSSAENAEVKAFEKLKSAFQTQQEEYYARAEKAEPDEHLQLYEQFHPANTMPDEFLQLEKAHRGTLVGLSCLHHLVSQAQGWNTKLPSVRSKRKALAILHAYYADHADLDLIFHRMYFSSRFPEEKTLLRRAAESPHRHVRGTALYTLAKKLTQEFRFFEVTDAQLELLSNDPEGLKELNVMERRGYYADVEPEESRREALRVIEQVISEYSDGLEPVNTPRGPILLEIKREKRDPFKQRDRVPLGILAEGLKNELTVLHVGAEAPDIDRPDAFGKPLRLENQRGKVVILMFSFKGCGPCEVMYPGIRALISEMKGRPFAFLGVMSDETVETVKEAVESKTITWPVWWEGLRGPISAQWNVELYPRVFVLDHKGVVRYKSVHKDLLTRAVHKLVAEAEEAQRSR